MRDIPLPADRAPSQRAEELVSTLFQDASWNVAVRSPAQARPDIVVRKGSRVYTVELKSVSESRRDRVVPALSEAILRAQAAARAYPRARPLAVVALPDLPETLVARLEQFVHEFAPDVAVGLIGWDGRRQFFGEGLHALNAKPMFMRGGPPRRASRIPSLFSDLNQWMLKVLLAPELPEHLLKAPRSVYRNVSELAVAADVSVMSAFRFAEQLRMESFLDEDASQLRLVRRQELFSRWQAFVGLRSCLERPMRFLIRGDVRQQVRQLVKHSEGCLGLFAAADALKLGFVVGSRPMSILPVSKTKSWPVCAALWRRQPASRLMSSSGKRLLRNPCSEAPYWSTRSP